MCGEYLWIEINNFFYGMFIAFVAVFYFIYKHIFIVTLGVILLFILVELISKAKEKLKRG